MFEDLNLDVPEFSQDVIKYCCAGRTNEVMVDVITMCSEVAHFLVAMTADVNHENHLLRIEKAPAVPGLVDGFSSKEHQGLYLVSPQLRVYRRLRSLFCYLFRQ